MVEVILETSINHLSNDLYSSINWSKIGLKTFKQFKNSIFEEFEERDLRFSLEYEKVTPFANQDVEIKYVNEVQFVGKEEEFNLESFDIFSRGSSEEEESSILSLDGFTVSEDIVIETVESMSEEKEFPPQQADIVEESVVGSLLEETISDANIAESFIVEAPKVRKREITYYNGMSLRQFLRENPRSTIDVAENYFTRKEIMKEIQLGRVIKRGKKLFI